LGQNDENLERAPLALCNLVATEVWGTEYGVSNLSVYPDEHLNI